MQEVQGLHRRTRARRWRWGFGWGRSGRRFHYEMGVALVSV